MEERREGGVGVCVDRFGRRLSGGGVRGECTSKVVAKN